MDIELENISKSFNGKSALEDINLKIQKKKIVAFIGPSGSGKTTLLRIINLLDPPSRGTLILDCKNTVDLTGDERYELRKRMALVFQNPSLFQISVADNIAYGLKIRNTDPKVMERAVQRALRLVGLNDMKSQFAPTLSAGEAQRASFARAIVFKPELLLLDEYTANLDPANVKLLEESVLKYQEDADATIILATHNLFQARRLADDIVFMYDGKIVEQGEKDDFFTNPTNPLTKSFLSGELIY